MRGLREFRWLLNETENYRQLFSYLIDTQVESQGKKSQSRYFLAGEFFSRAFGLDLAELQMYNLGKFILGGDFKPKSLTGYKMDAITYDKYRGSIDTYWRGIKSGV